MKPPFRRARPAGELPARGPRVPCHVFSAPFTQDESRDPGSPPTQAGPVETGFPCDVLEHVRGLERVISETSRVLKPGGIYFFDTINRTWRSRLIELKVL